MKSMLQEEDQEELFNCFEDHVARDAEFLPYCASPLEINYATAMGCFFIELLAEARMGRTGNVEIK